MRIYEVLYRYINKIGTTFFPLLKEKRLPADAILYKILIGAVKSNLHKIPPDSPYNKIICRNNF